MKKQFLRSICFLLTLALLFSAFGPAARPVAFAAQEDEPVAEISLCVSGMLFPYYFFGHSWICIFNISSQTLTVGEIRLAPGEMMSVGLHSNAGMTYNREMSRFGGKTVNALRRQITAAQLQNAQREILSSDWDHYYLFSHNCTHFATAVWKAATGDGYRPSVFPLLLKSQLPSDQLTQIRIGSIQP